MRKHPILNWIESNVSDTILSRGRSYVGNVSKLKYDEDTETWTAQVVGSDVYDVEISTDEEDEFYAECDCPYDWEENCKHIVAVALKIAEEGVEETKSTTKIKSILAETKYLLPDFPAATFYENVVLKIPKEAQLDFFKQLFHNNDEVRKQFVKFAEADLMKTFAHKETLIVKSADEKIDIAALSAEIYESIMDIEIDEEDYYSQQHRYNRYDYYSDDDSEGLEEFAIEELTKLLKPYQKKLKTHIDNNNLLSAIAILTAMHEASDGLPETLDTGDYELFYNGFGYTVLNIFADESKSILHKLEHDVINQSVRLKISMQLLEIELPSHFDYFENMFMALCKDTQIAEGVLNHLKIKNLLMSETAELALYCNQVIGRNEDWLDLATQLYTEKDSIAKKLLLFHQENNNLEAFHKVAEKSIEVYANQKMGFVELVKNTLSYQVNPSFYLGTFEYYAQAKSDLETYKNLCGYWSNTQKMEFTENQRLKNTFYAEILTHEERFDDLLKFVEAQINDYYYSYDLLSFIGKRFPEEAFSLFKQRFFKDEDRMKMDRSGYNAYCKYLIHVKDIDVPLADKKILVSRLSSIYSGRPAFLDELRKAAKLAGL